MPTQKLLLPLVVLATLFSGPLGAQQPAARAVDPREEIARKIPGGARVDELRATPVPGIWEFTRDGDIAYVSADGRYAISGDMVELGSNVNLTENHRREIRARELAAVPESQMLIFGPKEAKYTLTVFTDIDCPYCRKLHSQIGEYNRLGIRVRYLLYPRNGPNTESWTKAEQVWCSSNRNDALTRAKQGQDLKVKVCTDTPLPRFWALGQKFNITGTPALVMSDGEMLSGYMPPDVLLKHLQEEQKR
ncbi:MAG TPA: DsbC family protein [Steroidobacteraceae bacterium]|nr:DsbC family protein [Steroidobacteraceae bacterium]